MKRVFVIISLFIGLFNTVNSQPIIFQKTDTKEDSTKICLSLSMDSILVEYCGSVNKYSGYYISFGNNDKIVVKSRNSTFNHPSITFTIDSLDLIRSFVTYINKFYIDKTEKIILERKKTNILIDADYPMFFISGYKKGKKIVNESTIFSDNELFVFNPLFIEFHEFTRLLVGYVDAELEKIE